MELKYEQKQVFHVQYFDLEEFIELEYGRTIEIPANEELSNGCSQLMKLSSNEPLSEYRLKQLDEWEETGDGSFMLRIIMQDMVNRNVIPEGNYLIEISW